MLSKFAIRLSPEPKCPKLSSDPNAACPTHKVAMVRTVVYTEKSVKAQLALIGKTRKLADDILGAFKF